MSDQDREAPELADAATLHSAREEIVQALGPLAASPLDQQAVERMRRALARAESPAVRRALRRLGFGVAAQATAPRSSLVSVSSIADGAAGGRLQAPQPPARPCRLVAAPAPGGAA